MPDVAPVIPFLRDRDAAAAIDFLVNAFGFKKLMVVPGEREREIGHAELRLGSSVIMVSSYREPPADAGPSAGDELPARGLYVTVADADAHCARAKAAGARIVNELHNTEYGSREYSAHDPEGYHWTFGTYVPEMAATTRHERNVAMAVNGAGHVTAYLCAKGAAEAIEFYKNAFGAEEKYRMTGDDGAIGHAEITIGETTLMISDEWPEGKVFSPQTLGGSATAFVLDVPDCDAVFERALKAGAKLTRPIRDEPYGRGGWLDDPFGHRWNVMTSNPNFKAEDMQ
jgi:PhnB protein